MGLLHILTKNQIIPGKLNVRLQVGIKIIKECARVPVSSCTRVQLSVYVPVFVEKVGK